MKASALVKNAPNSLIYSVAAIFVACIVAFVVLAVTDSSSTEFRSFLNTVLNIAAVALSGGAAVAAGSAAKSSANAESQTNGPMTEKIAEGVRKVLAERDAQRDAQNEE